MALTPEVLKANEALTGLTDDQVAAITTLSVNDETVVINTKIGEHHGNIEKDVLETSGIAKSEGEKSFDYMKRVIGEFKTSATGSTALQTEIDTYKTKVADLESKIEKGQGDQATVQKLRDTEANLAALQTQYDTDKQGWTTKEKEFQGQITGIQVNAEFGKATSGLKFKAGYPEGVQKTLIDSATSGILATAKPDWVDADGKKVMVFRGADGEIMRNTANGLKPYTAAELISEKLKDVIDLGQKKPGTGTKPPGTGPDAIELVEVAGAKTQVEADSIISKYLLQQGELRGTASFAEKQAEIREKNGVSKLPMR
jgi:hypothetical protein